jgi:ABC-type uncharacterized transport system fused permease/ATPase subunit
MIFLILIIIGEAGLTLVLPFTRGYFFNLLELKINLYVGLLYFLGNQVALDFVQSWKAYVVTKFSLIKRETRTTCILNKSPLADSIGVDNYPQRVQEDIKLMYLNRYTVFAEYWISGIILVGLIVINYQHYLLIGSALVYAVISIIIAYLFNPRMVRAEKEVQKQEANYRVNLNMGSLFGACSASLVNAKVQLEYLLFTKLQNGILLILPYLFLLPAFIKGTITLGDLMRIATTFQLLVLNADILIAMFPKLVIANASKERVEEIEC